MHAAEVDYDFLRKVATFIDAEDLGELFDEWGEVMFLNVAEHAWESFPCLRRRLEVLDARRRSGWLPDNRAT
jgi:hypothetical protein